MRMILQFVSFDLNFHFKIRNKKKHDTSCIKKPHLIVFFLGKTK